MEHGCDWFIEQKVKDDIADGWWEHKSISIHWECMMDPVNVEMKSIHKVILHEIWHPVFLAMKNKPVKSVLTKRPEKYAQSKYLERVLQTAS